MADLTILHTNDLHNHLTDVQAAKIKQHRASIPGFSLLFDAGDAISAGNITYHRDGEPILQRLNDVGYDAMVIGNREFHFTTNGFVAKIKDAHFPVLCANLKPTQSQPLPVKPSIRFSFDGRDVFVFGLTVPMITVRMASRHFSSYLFEDPESTASRILETLDPRPDLVILLSHLGSARDRDLARKLPGIDLIIGGHTHTALPEGEWVDRTLIVQAGWYAKWLGEVSCRFNPTNRQPQLNARLLPL
ncbi:MAG: metallophosphatase [Armatimonadetes bacterium]|nr:metallophosphatase [Armatimonadota bacterium]